MCLDFSVRKDIEIGLYQIRNFAETKIPRKPAATINCAIRRFIIYIYFACLFFVCLFVSNKRQNGWIDRAQIFCGTSRDPREGLWMIKISKNLCLKVFYLGKFLKMREIILWNPQTFCYILYKEKMLPDKATIKVEIKDVREAP